MKKVEMAEKQMASQHNTSASDMEMIRRLKRLEKFELQQALKCKMKPKLVSHQSESQQHNAAIENNDDMDINERAKHMTVKGTCTEVAKNYFRLTSAPDPAKVRPEPVLKQALKMLKHKWETKASDYIYIDDQFRSLRQDLTVQRI